MGLAQQLIDTAELGAQRKAALFDGRAERVAPIGARHEVAALKAEHVTHEPGSRGIAESEDLASDGPHGHRAALGQAADLAAPGAGREQHALGLDRPPILQGDAGHARAGAVGFDVRDARVLVKLDTARAAGLAQGVEHAARVDCVIAGHLERRVQRRGERGLELARLAHAQLPRLEAERVAQRELALQLARSPTSIPVAAWSSAANSGHICAERSPRASALRASSPNSTSATGASIPAATCEAARPATSRSSTVTAIPRWRARQAAARPMMPAPTTTTSADWPC